MYDNRDYADLKRDDIAVYNFRGYTVLKFTKETGELEIGKYADMCSFIKSDLKQMSEFLENCYMFSMGIRPELDHVEVN